MAKPKYFNSELFVDSVLQEFGMDSSNDHSEMRAEITTALAHRIMTVVIDNLSPKEFARVEKLRQDHPELDELDTIMMVAHEIEGLSQQLQAGIDSLFHELVYDAQEIQRFIREAEEAKAKTS